MNTPKFENVWDALIDDSGDLKKKSDYLILIQAWLYGQSGSVEDKAEKFGLSVSQVTDLVNGSHCLTRQDRPAQVGVHHHPGGINKGSEIG